MSALSPVGSLRALRRPSTRVLRRLAAASIAANIGIVVTGGAVRLTGSGLGCPTWPRCTDGSYVPNAAMGAHGAIEFGNRMLTYVLGAVALATLVAVWRARPARPDARVSATVLFLGIPTQAGIGGVSVLTGLNPWVVMAHLMVSMVLIGLATLLHHQVGGGQIGEAGGPVRLTVAPLLRRCAVALLPVLAVVVYLGTIVTGSGPHAGDQGAARTGLDPGLLSRIHAESVLVLIGLSVTVALLARATGTPAVVRRGVGVLLAVELAQATVGYVQYLTDLPELLVGLHMLGAGVLVVAVVHLVVSTRTRDLRAASTLPRTASPVGVSPSRSPG